MRFDVCYLIIHIVGVLMGTTLTNRYSCTFIFLLNEAQFVQRESNGMTYKAHRLYFFEA